MRTYVFAGLVLAACSGGGEDSGGFGDAPPPMTPSDAASTGEPPTPTSSSGDEPGSSGEPGSSSSSDATTGALDDTGTGDDSSSGEASTGTTGDGGVAEVVIDPAGVQQLEVGALAGLTAVARDAQGRTIADAAITWRSSDGMVLYVDGEGGLLGVTAGAAEVTAEVDGVVSAPFVVDVTAFDPPPVTFTEVYALAGTSCALAGCHVDGVQAGGLRWDRGDKATYETLIKRAAVGAPEWFLVVPDEPRLSYVLHKLAIDAPAAGERMPKGAAPLTAAEVQVLLRWILDGAPLN